MAASCLTPKMLCLISKHSVEIPDQVGNDRLVRKDGKFRATLHMDFLFPNTTDRVAVCAISCWSTIVNVIFTKRDVIRVVRSCRRGPIPSPTASIIILGTMWINRSIY